MRTFAIAVLLAFLTSLASAQPPKFEIAGQIGYTLSEGVAIDGVLYDNLDPESSFSYGVDFGYFITPAIQVGFLWAQESSTLIGTGVAGVPDADLVDLDINNYHGFLAYNYGYNPQVVPFFLFGMGATQYVGGEVAGVDVGNETQFSTTLGGGVKVFPRGKLGARFSARWTPTYIKTNPDGWWCGYYGCYTYGDVDYSHQFEMSVGAIYRY